MISIEQHGRVRLVTLDRPEVLNAFNTEMYNAASQALRDADTDGDTAVVVITGKGRAFSAGQDLGEMASLADAANSDGEMESGFPGFVDALTAFSKPLVVAINGLGLGIGMTILGYADLGFMADTAKLRCPFTSLGVAPEAASSVLFPPLLGWQNAAWVLLSAEWISAQEAKDMGLVFEVTSPEELVDIAMAKAGVLASRPISSLRAVKAAMTAQRNELIGAARAREDAAFGELLGSPANVEALTAFLEGRDADFSNIDGE